MIDVAALRSLMVLESTGTVAGTACLLGYTPSAVSQQLRRLERQLGTQLVERVGRGVVLTPAGRAAAGRAHVLLDDLENFRAGLCGAEHLTGQVRLASFATAERGIAAPALAQLHASAPDVDVTVVEYDPPAALVALQRGEADLALIHTWDGLPTHLPEGIDTTLVAVDTAEIAVHRGHRLASRRRIAAADLKDETWACVHAGSVCHQWLMQMHDGLTASPRIRYWTSEFASQLAYVDAGLAIALLPRLGRDTLPDNVTTVAIDNPTPRRPIHLAWRHTRHNDPVLRAVIESLTPATQDGHEPTR